MELVKRRTNKTQRGKDIIMIRSEINQIETKKYKDKWNEEQVLWKDKQNL